MSNSIWSNLVKDKVIELSASALLNSASQVDSLLEVSVLETKLTSHLLKVRVL